MAGLVVPDCPQADAVQRKHCGKPQHKLDLEGETRCSKTDPRHDTLNGSRDEEHSANVNSEDWVRTVQDMDITERTQEFGNRGRQQEDGGGTNKQPNESLLHVMHRQLNG